MSSELSREEVLAIRQKAQYVLYFHGNDIMGSINDWAITDASLRTRLAEQTARAEAQIQYNAGLIERMADLTARAEEADSLRASCHSFEHQVADLTAKLQHCEELAAHKEQRIVEGAGIIDDLTAKLAAVREMRETDLSEYLRKQEVHQQQLAAMTQERDVWKQSADRHREEHACLAPQLADAQATISAREKEVDVMQAQRNFAESRIETTQAEAERLRLKLRYLADLGDGKSESNCFARQALTPPVTP